MSRTFWGMRARDALIAAGVVLLAAGAGVAGLAERKAAANLQTYQTKYYVIHSDLDIDTVREAAARLTAMAEEYHRRTRGFSGTIRRRLPFYLFANPEDYHAAGGVPGSTGIYKRRSLMALARPGRRGGVWHTIQHEGFHQFARSVIGGKWPIWLNEGLAEYFAHGIWTGDNFVSGVIPPTRLRRVKAMIKGGTVRPFPEMLVMDQADWNAAIDRRNYDQAWSMVHFLVHGDAGKYQKAFSQFVNDVAAYRPWKLAFARRFGTDVVAFQNTYARWWMSLEGNPTRERYVQAVVETLTSFLARCFSQRQTFDTVEAFFKAARDGQLKDHPDQWLPPKLLADVLKPTAALGRWSLDKDRPLPRVVLHAADGTVFTGAFTLRRTEVTGVKVTISRPPEAPATRPAAAARPRKQHRR